MQPVAQFLHAGEFLVYCNGTVGITLGSFPTVVDIHIAITVVGQTFLDKSLGAANHLVLCNTQAPAVPAVPTHRRCKGNLTATTDGEFLCLLALGILGLDSKGIRTRLVQLTTQGAIIGIDGKTLWQIVRSNLHRLLATHAEAEMNRRTWTNTIERSCVEARLCRSSRSKDVLGDILCGSTQT